VFSDEFDQWWCDVTNIPSCVAQWNVARFLVNQIWYFSPSHQFMKKRLLTLGLLVALASTEARAQVLLNETFAGENGGVTQTNYNSFANWTVTGAVDLITPTNPYGIVCTGSCVDLSGSPGPGRMTSNPFAFNDGDVIKMTFRISGNQRNSQFNTFTFGTSFTGGAIIGPYEYMIPSLSSSPGGLPYSGLSASTSLAGQMGFQTWSFQFQALGTGAAQFYFDASDASSVGPILDDVLVERVATQSVVPEPSTYAMLGLGLGALGFAARRRRTNV
jgi:hypothetical protein